MNMEQYERVQLYKRDGYSQEEAVKAVLKEEEQRHHIFESMRGRNN